jgi:hypothetical protein
MHRNLELRRHGLAVAVGADGRRKKARSIERDYLHGTVEVYDASGRKHLGEFDPWDGRQISAPDPTRSVES